MMKINAIIPTGETASVGLVRYFEAYGKKYFVYTLNEKDEQGFVKLYVCKVNNGIGEFIDDDGEWKSIKDEFKKIIGENSENNSTTANDLNPRELANINVKGHRVIKLMENYVNSLSANQKEFGQGSEAAATPAAPVNNFEMPSMPSFDAPAAPANNFKIPSMPSFDVPAAPANNFEQMYNELKEKFDRCNAELERITNENVELRIKLDDIREILNEN